MQVPHALCERSESVGSAVGTSVEEPAPTPIAANGVGGMDAVPLDSEHAGAASPTNATALENVDPAAEHPDTAVPTGVLAVDPPLSSEALEAAGRGLLEPRLRTASEIRWTARAMARRDGQ